MIKTRSSSRTLLEPEPLPRFESTEQRLEPPEFGLVVDRLKILSEVDPSHTSEPVEGQFNIKMESTQTMFVFKTHFHDTEGHRVVRIEMEDQKLDP